MGKNIPYRCQICVHSFLPSADIIVGDAWNENKSLGNMNMGISLIVVNGEKGSNILKGSKNLHLEKVEKIKLYQSQKNLFKKLNNGKQKILALSRIESKLKIEGIAKVKIPKEIKEIFSISKFTIKYLMRRLLEK